MNAFRFLDIGKTKPKKIKSICLESETILEELEEYYPGNDIDLRNHTFYVPQPRSRLDSFDTGGGHDYADNNSSSLAPIMERKEEPEDDTTQ